MAQKKYYVDVNFMQNILYFARLHPATAHPNSPTPRIAQLYYNTTDKNAYIFDGTNWLPLFGQKASETVLGIVEIATDAEFVAGTDMNGDNPLVVIPSQVKTAVDAVKILAVAGDLSGALPNPIVEQSTSSDGFLVKTGAYEVRIIGTAANELSVRNSGNTGYGDLNAQNITVKGNLTVDGIVKQVSTEEIHLEDSILVLNDNETGVPSQDAGLVVERGTSDNVSMIWNESLDKWTFSFDGSNFYAIAGTSTNTINCDGSATEFVIAHLYGSSDLSVTVRDEANEIIEAAVKFGTGTVTITIQPIQPVGTEFYVTLIG